MRESRLVIKDGKAFLKVVLRKRRRRRSKQRKVLPLILIRLR